MYLKKRSTGWALRKDYSTWMGDRLGIHGAVDLFYLAVGTYSFVHKMYFHTQVLSTAISC